MKTMVKIIFGVINTFLAAFVSYKVYGYFSPHTGLDLPELDYYNMLAIVFIISSIFSPIATLIELMVIRENVVEKEPTTPEYLTKTGILLLMWGFSYLYYIILF